MDAAPEVFGCPGRCGREGVAVLTGEGWRDGLCDACWRKRQGRDDSAAYFAWLENLFIHRNTKPPA